jgi:hypothetical protein
MEARIWIAFGIDVLKDRAQCLTYSSRSLALGGDQDQLAALSLGLVFNEAAHSRVEGIQRALKKVQHHTPPIVKVMVLTVKPALPDLEFISDNSKSQNEAGRP